MATVQTQYDNKAMSSQFWRKIAEGFPPRMLNPAQLLITFSSNNICHIQVLKKNLLPVLPLPIKLIKKCSVKTKA